MNTRRRTKGDISLCSWLLLALENSLIGLGGRVGGVKKARVLLVTLSDGDTAPPCPNLPPTNQSAGMDSVCWSLG